MGLIQSRIVFGSPFWGIAKKMSLVPLITAQKKALRKIYNLKYRESTKNHFVKGSLLKLPELIKYSSMTLFFVCWWSGDPSIEKPNVLPGIAPFGAVAPK